MNNKAYFITIEGGEGAGKSTVIRAIEQYLVSKGLEIASTREPGGIKISEQIREIILDKCNTEMDGLTEAYLYAAARRQHIVEKIAPALEQKKIVICDRYIDSSVAYQGYARNLGMDTVMEINSQIIGNYVPDLTIYLDVNPETGLERIFKNNRNTNRLDLEGLEFHKKVREGYILQAKRCSQRIVKLDANGQTEKVLKQIFDILDNRLGLKEKN